MYLDMILESRATEQDICPSFLLKVAMEVALAAKVDTKKDRSVFFSGTTQTAAETFVAENPDFDVIHSRPAGAMLEVLNLFSQESGLTREEAYQPWNILATRYALEASGDIKAMIDNPKPEKTFRRVELGLLMDNASVTHINGRDKSAFAQDVTGHTSLAKEFAKAKSMINARSRSPHKTSKKLTP